MITIDDLLSAPTADDIFQRFLTNLVTMGIPADQWRQGGTARTILRVVANMYVGAWTLASSAIAGQFLTKATGPWLALLAHYVYGVDARGPTFATGQVTLSNTAGGSYSYAAGEATFENAAKQKTYVNTEAFTLGPGTPSVPATVTFGVQATEVGPDSSATPGQIDTLVTVMLGVTVTNAASVVGLPAQSDDEVRALCQAKLGALSVRGPRTAYAYAIQTATRIDGSPVDINRWSISAASHTGTVTIYLASPSGTPDPTDVTAVQDSIVAQALPEAVTLSLSGATVVSYAPSLTVWAVSSPGLAPGDVQTAAADALETYLAAYPIGGLATDVARGLFASAVEGVIKASHPAIFAVSGATDLALTDGQVASDAATLTVRMAAAP